tara:strand:+ start:72 stop:521 length:450 start_codon:yes stop_codon:yes gene_type:complete
MSEEDKKHGVAEPNQGVNGKLASNMTGEPIEGLFDYGDITERDKSVVNEVIELIQSRPGIPGDMIVAELKTKFQLVTIPMMKVEESVWHQLTKDERIGQSTQGFRETVDKDGNKIRIPHIGFSADLDYLDGFVNRLAQKINSIPKAEDK